MIEQKHDAILNDLAKLKAVLVKRADEDDRENLFEAELYTDMEAFDNFCQRLAEEKNYRDLFVSIPLLCFFWE